MGDVWGTAVPNWITAITAVAALVLATIGALAAWRSLQQQIADSQAAREREIASQARTVTAQWVTRQRAGEDGRTWTEWGLRVINHGTTTVFDVRADVEVAAGPRICRPCIRSTRAICSSSASSTRTASRMRSSA